MQYTEDCRASERNHRRDADAGREKLYGIKCHKLTHYERIHTQSIYRTRKPDVLRNDPEYINYQTFMKKTVKKKTVVKKLKKKVVMGRPTKYDASLVGKTKEYLLMCGREQTKLPTKQGLALFLGVDDETLNEWAKTYKDFSATLKELMLTQADQLINDGIYGGKEVNSTIVKLLLQNNHGMKERTDLTTKDEHLPIQVVSYKEV